jgi:hypothetical protein
MNKLLTSKFLPVCVVFLAGWGAVPRSHAVPAPQPAPQPTDSAPSPLPTPPGDAKVFDQVQNTTDNWTSCSICAHGSTNTDNFWMAPFVSSPSMSGSSRELFVGGPGWSSALFIKTLPGNSWASHFLWEFWVYFDPASADTTWSAEFDLWQSLDHQQLMMGSQCDMGDGFWDVWDSSAGHWVTTSIGCPHFAPATWHHIQWYIERLGSNQYRYVTLVVDGKAYNIDQVYHSVDAPDWDDAVGIQWQLDENSGGHALHEWIDNVKLTIW